MSGVMSRDTVTARSGTGVAFPDHTVESAPPAARRAMAAIKEGWGYLPSGVARLATSPHALDGFLKLNGIFEGCTLDRMAREVLTMTVATRNGCHVCVAIHTQRLTSMGADASLIAALRDATSHDATPREATCREATPRDATCREATPSDATCHEATPRGPLPLADPRLEAVRVFTLRVLDTAGDVGEQALRDFLGHGYTPQNALEIVLGIGAYTLSTLANRLTQAPLDPPLIPFEW